jgi:redox-sensitive bicupin YhaK (pirin superfamily)
MPNGIDLIISPRKKNIGSFEVRRAIPYAKRRMVGPFIFFDHMGPARFEPGQGIDVRSHPHIGLATITFLFDGEIHHRDSLGFHQPVRPGDVNWMTAGRGIVHSERTGPETRAAGHTLHGIQTWIALPQAEEETDPAFHHHPKAALPVIERDGASLSLIAGTAFGEASPVKTFSEMFYLGGSLSAGADLVIPDEHEERAVYVVDGTITVNDQTLEEGQMAVLSPDTPVHARTRDGARIMLAGGAPMDGERLIWWNLVASTQALIDRAKKEWKNGEFAKVADDEDEFIPLPEDN